jgi:hypothetical protein
VNEEDTMLCWIFGERLRYAPAGLVPWWRRWGRDAERFLDADVAADPELAAIMRASQVGLLSLGEAVERLHHLRKRRAGWWGWTRRGLPW